MWDRLQSSYWFLPLVFALVGIVLARILFGFDLRVDNSTLPFQESLVSARPDEARTAMLTLAGTTLTTTGIVFSLMTLPISVVASQFGSRLLRVYLRDRTTQFVLSVFTLTFAYCIMLALLIPPESVSTDAPSLSTTFALLLAVLAFGCLIVLIHHVGVTLQAPSVVAAASKELQKAVHVVVENSHREMELGNPEGTRLADHKVRGEGTPIHADKIGYIQFVDMERLLPIASSRDLILRMECTPGDFVEVGDLLAYAWPSEKVGSGMFGLVRGCFLVGNSRQPMQDLRYAVSQLTEIGERALSAAINDPYTAMTVMDHQAAALGVYAERVRDHSTYYDRRNRLRMIYTPVRFAELIDLAFTMPRLAIGANIIVYLKMLDTLEHIGVRADPATRVDVIAQHVALTREQVEMLALPAQDRQRVLTRCHEVTSHLIAHRKEVESLSKLSQR